MLLEQTNRKCQEICALIGKHPQGAEQHCADSDKHLTSSARLVKSFQIIKHVVNVTFAMLIWI